MSIDKRGFIRTALYDTFDWRLYKSGQILLLTDHPSMILKDLGTGRAVFETPVKGQVLPRFSRDFHDEKIRTIIQRIIDIRALVKKVEFEEASEICDIFNNETHPVARIIFLRFSTSEGADVNRQLEVMEVMSLPGHENELNAIFDMIRQLNIPSFTENPLIVFIRNMGLEPGGYSSKINVQLKPEEHCSQAIKKIIEQTLTVARQNIIGIKEDIDTEFLHDFRVAVRRTRSALTQIKMLFPGEDYAIFTEDLRYFGQISNRLRDIDVYLLNRDNYLEMLPTELQSGILPFFKFLQKKRRHELEKFVQTLNDERYNRLITKWELLLNTEYHSDSALSNSARPVIDVARQYILQRYKKIIKSGENIDKTGSDTTLHRLRIQCKKLRYLLEFFTSLFPRDDIELFVKQLKKMQDTLGEYNDLSIQRNELKRRLDQITTKNKRQFMEAAAIGGLITLFKDRQRSIRSRFKTVFDEFSNRENTELFNRLFG